MEPLAIGSLVAGIVSIPTGACCAFINIPLIAVGFILGFVALNNINKDPTTKTGKGLAYAGMVCSGLGLVALILRIVLAGATMFMLNK